MTIAIPIAAKTFDELRGSDQDSISSVSADSDMESDNNKKRSQKPRRIPLIQFLAGQIHDQIQSLYYLSVTMRRPAVVNDCLGSTNKMTAWPLYSFFEEHDLKHVVAKIMQWKGLTKTAVTDAPDEEPAAPIDISLTSPLEQLPTDMRILAKRLANANTKRREQLDYWNHHPDVSDVSHNDNINEGSIAEHSAQRLTDQSGKTLTRGPQHSKPISGTGYSDMENTTRLSVTGPHDRTESGQGMTIYEPSVAGSTPSACVPDVPQSAHSKPHFGCPYCHQTLKSEPMMARQNWK